MHSKAAAIYLEACNREHVECAVELVYAFDNNEKEVSLSDRVTHLNDADVSCIAEALRLGPHSLRVLNMEGNAFGLPGLQSLLEAIEANPGIIRELRLGRNKLKDQGSVVIGHTLSRDGCGLKVLDLSENEITKLGVIPIASALSNGHCNLVELSLHNNKIESDAATFLAQAIRKAGKLKHLHLGYNAIRDTGASQLAQCIPVTLTLSTLDLTANRIGPSGGKELARALMSSSCNIQRLNLRHNLFDSETIELFGQAISTNTSLIQLFLGFMNPTPNSAAVVLSKLEKNRTLLLLDIYGWKFHPEITWELIDNIQKRNNTLVAIVSDAFQPIARQIDEGNEERDVRGQHPIYIGPDDRDAYIATKSIRRLSRAQSRRHSRASSRASVFSRTESPSHRRANERSFSRKDSDVHSRNSSRAAQEASYSAHQDSPLQAKFEQLESENHEHSRNSKQAHSFGRKNASGVAPPETVPFENSSQQLNPRMDGSMQNLVEHLQQELEQQRRVQRVLESRIAALERWKESCGRGELGSADRPRSARRAAANNGNGVRSVDDHNGNYRNSHSGNHPCSMDTYRNCSGRSSDPTDLQHFNNSPFPQRESDEMSVHDSGYISGRLGSRGGPAEYPQISEARSSKSVPPAEPLELPKENKPVEVVLQASTKPQENYQPNLGPAPSKDVDPPRRKGSIHRL